MAWKKSNNKTSKNKKMLGMAAGVAAAAGATAAGIAVARKRKSPAVLHVSNNAQGWDVKAEGSEEPLSHHATKKEAVGAARDLAESKAPSRLVIHRVDGTIQTRHAYGVEG